MRNPLLSESESTFTRQVRAGSQQLGTFIKLAGVESIDLISQSGFDFAVIDFEHSQLSFTDVSRTIRHGVAISLPTLVRVPTVDSGLINRLLEAGASGIQLSTVRTVREAEQLRLAMRYPPDGARSVSPMQAGARYGETSLIDYLKSVKANPSLVIGQIETASTDDPLNDIARYLDVIFIGTSDLSVDLGAPGQLNDAIVLKRIKEIASVAKTASVMLGAYASATSDAEMLRTAGATYLVLGSDLHALREGLSGAALLLDNADE